MNESYWLRDLFERSSIGLLCNGNFYQFVAENPLIRFPPLEGLLFTLDGIVDLVIDSSSQPADR